MSKSRHQHPGLFSQVSAAALLSALATASLLTFSGPASAQGAAGAAPASSSPLEVITVTAEFRRGNVQNTPIAITAVNAAMLEARSQTSIVEAATSAPNVTLTRAQAAFGNSITASIRGVGQFDFNPAFEPGVGLYVDEVYYSQLSGSVLDLLDVDRIEVLRGPQGTLQGKNSIGGAIKMFSRQPVGDNTGSISLTYGDFNRVEGRGSADFMLVPDQVMARASFVSKSQDGYVTRKDFACENPLISVTGAGGPLVPNPVPVMTTGESCKLGTEGGTDYVAGRLMLRWVASDAVNVNVIGDYTNDNSENAATTLIALSDTGFAPQTQRNISVTDGVNRVRANTTLVPALIPRDFYTSYASFYMPGGSMETNNGGPNITVAPMIAEDRVHLRSWGVSSTVDWQLLDNLSLKSISSYRNFTSLSAEDNDVSPLANSLGMEREKHWQASQEVRLSGSLFENALEYTLGGFYFDQVTRYSTHQNLRYTSAMFHFLGDDPVEATTKAAFIHGIWHITDEFEVAGGVRYTEDEKTYTFSRRHAETFGGAVAFNGVPTVPPLAFPPGSCAFAVGGPPNQDCAPNYNWPVAGLEGVSSSAETKRVDWRGAATYHWTPNFMTYFQYSTGFKGGGINPRPFNFRQVLPFGPEKLKAYEVGFKSTWWDMVRLNTAAFFNQYKDVQATINNCTAQAGPGFGIPCALPVGAGDADVWGFEVETEIHPTEGLQFDASYSYLNFEYTRVSPGTGLTTNSITAYTPETQWNAGVQYEFVMGDWGSLTPRLDVDFQDEFFANATNTPGALVESRTLGNARLTWQSFDETLSAALEVTNLADEEYFVNKFDLLAISGFTAGQPGAPREWAVTLKKKF